MAIVYLADTNIFLEILLKQAKSQVCKDFLNRNVGNISISDFSLHSIGVILFKQSEVELFSKFLDDTLSKVQLVTLPKLKYKKIIANRMIHTLDFDDTYQYTVCEHYGYELTTMDEDFKNIEGITVLFL